VRLGERARRDRAGTRRGESLFLPNLDSNLKKEILELSVNRLGVASDEWRSMVLFGLYSGQRLGDIATLKWNNIDLVHRELRLSVNHELTPTRCAEGIVHVRNCPARQQCKLEAYPTLRRLPVEYELRVQVFSSFADADHYGCQFTCPGNCFT
jgi:integrase